jgi:hypothetical protein
MESEINRVSEEIKKEFSGSNDYLSGVNDATYTIVRKVLKCLKENKSNIQSGLKDNDVYCFSINDIFKL